MSDLKRIVKSPQKQGSVKPSVIKQVVKNVALKNTSTKSH